MSTMTAHRFLCSSKIQPEVPKNLRVADLPSMYAWGRRICPGPAARLKVSSCELKGTVSKASRQADHGGVGTAELKHSMPIGL